MTIQELQKKYDRFFEKVRRVRGWQREWKKWHVESDRQMMIKNERELDNMITEEVRLQKSKQNGLF